MYVIEKNKRTNSYPIYLQYSTILDVNDSKISQRKYRQIVKNNKYMVEHIEVLLPPIPFLLSKIK